MDAHIGQLVFGSGEEVTAEALVSRRASAQAAAPEGNGQAAVGSAMSGLHKPKASAESIEFQFRQAVINRRKTWVFDWIISLYILEQRTNKSGGNQFRAKSTDQGLRRQLEIIETKQPAWVFVNSLAHQAASLSDKQEEVVRSNVNWMLGQLYSDIREAEKWVLTPNDSGSRFESQLESVLDTVGFVLHGKVEAACKGPAISNLLRSLYEDEKDFRLVGPVGERPIHVCFLLAGVMKSTNKEIAKGIVGGIKDFILNVKVKTISTQLEGGDLIPPNKEEEENILKLNKDEGKVGYGKDYCAALAAMHSKERINCVSSTLSPPYSKIASEFAQHNTAQDPARHKYAGLYEGETILQFAITSKETKFVKWYTEQYGPASVLKPAVGDFFHPRQSHQTISYGQCLQIFKRMTGSEEINEYSASPDTYFGSCPVFFAASQGRAQESVEIMSILVDALQKCALDLKSHAKAGSENGAPQWCGELDKLLARQAAVNIRDEYGNTLLHLAAMNGSMRVFEWLFRNGADMNITNNEGLTPLSLTARFGLWSTFSFIRTLCYEQPLWQFGFVSCKRKDLSHIDTTRNVQDSNRCHRSFEARVLIFNILDSFLSGGSLSIFVPKKSAFDSKLWSNPHVRSMSMHDPLQTVHPLETVSFYVQRCREYLKNVPFVSALEIIQVFRPRHWVGAVQDCIDDLVLKKWQKCYRLVFFSQTVVPFVINFALFGAMWQHRQISVRENSGVPDWIAPLNAEADAQCGWKGIRDSISGRIQVVLLFYGTLSLAALAWRQLQMDFRVIDPEGKGNWTKLHYLSFMYNNLESLFSLVSSVMFIVMGAARIAAGDGCNSNALSVEKNTMAIAGLFLFVNTINILKPIKMWGELFLIIYKMIIKDLLSFVIVYMSLFLAFLTAVQTIQSGENYYIGQLTSTNVTSAGIGIDVSTCQDRIKSTSDTAYKLFTTSLGDGFGDILQMSRTKADPSCGGYEAAHLLAVLWITWVVLTNILELNLFVAILNNTMTNEADKSEDEWYCDILTRVIAYERRFPELQKRAHKPSSSSGLQSWIDDILLILYCVPEIHFVCQLFGITAMADRLWIQYKKHLAETDELEELTDLSTDATNPNAPKVRLAGLLNGFIHFDDCVAGSLDIVTPLNSLKGGLSFLDADSSNGMNDSSKKHLARFLLWGVAHDLARLHGSVRLSTKLVVEAGGKGPDDQDGDETKKGGADDDSKKEGEMDGEVDDDL